MRWRRPRQRDIMHAMRSIGLMALADFLAAAWLIIFLLRHGPRLLAGPGRLQLRLRAGTLAICALWTVIAVWPRLVHMF
jgi:hypothetical protein